MAVVGGRRARGFCALTASLLCLIVAGGCGGSATGDDDDDGGCSTGAARGSDACHRWQKAVCDVGLRCEGAGRCQCLETMGSINCTGDDVAEDCATVMQGLSCEAAVPAQCSLDLVADLPWAQAGCADFLDAYCTAADRCGYAAKADCRVNLQGSGEGQIDCTRALGLKPRLGECLTALETHRCDAADLPPACVDVVLVY